MSQELDNGTKSQDDSFVIYDETDDIDIAPTMHRDEGYISHLMIPPWASDLPPLCQIQEAKSREKKIKKTLWDKLKLNLKLIGTSYALTFLDNAMRQDSIKNLIDSDEPIKSNFPVTLLAKYTLSPTHQGTDVCDEYNGRVFDLLDDSRPVLASEGRGFTTVHPNCHCTWDMVLAEKSDTLSDKEKQQIKKIENHIKRNSQNHTLHTIKQDGTMSKKTRGTNPITEALRDDFSWVDEEYLTNLKALAKREDGKLYMVRAAEPTITNHMSEGESHPRKLTSEELAKMSRTAIGKKMDVNHDYTNATDSVILDSEYDLKTNQLQMIVLEKDKEIIRAINNGQIDAVSINGGYPRTMNQESCEVGTCLVPRGVILGEDDDIAMTWVVTDDDGINFRGKRIEKAEPGVKTTLIELA